jgi:hypothetical protein
MGLPYFFAILNYFLATIIAAGRDIVATVKLPRHRVGRQGWLAEPIVGAAHSALGRGFSIFLYGHVLTLCLE